MRGLSYILIALGIYLLAATGYDEYRGITYKPASLLRTRRYNQAYLYRIPVHREQNPELFRQFMNTHWLYAVGVEGVGLILLLKNRPPE
jgi:hypothetical protein